jgi:ribosomal protein S18 acetylase RimI-like enzyme
MANSDLSTIRLASLEDAFDLASVHVSSWRATYAGVMPHEMLASLSVDARAASWEQIMREPATSGSTVVYVAELDGRIVGFASCGQQRTETLKKRGYDAEVSAIYVLKAYQRHAIGTRLLSAIASNLMARDFGAASVWVLRDNAPARQFYERYGARLVAERQDVRKNIVLSEVAYGWMHLAELARLTSVS